MTDKEFIKISRNSFLTDTAMPLVTAAFMDDKMSYAELKELYAYHAECEAKHSLATKKMLKRYGGDQIKTTIKVAELIVNSNANFTIMAENWLYNHVNKATLEYIHDDFMEACGFKKSDED